MEETINSFCCDAPWDLFHVNGEGYFLRCSKCKKTMAEQVGEGKGVDVFLMSNGSSGKLGDFSEQVKSDFS